MPQLVLPLVDDMVQTAITKSLSAVLGPSVSRQLITAMATVAKDVGVGLAEYRLYQAEAKAKKAFNKAVEAVVVPKDCDERSAKADCLQSPPPVGMVCTWWSAAKAKPKPTPTALGPKDPQNNAAKPQITKNK